MGRTIDIELASLSVGVEPQTGIKRLTTFHGIVVICWFAAAWWYSMQPSVPISRYAFINAYNSTTFSPSSPPLSCTQLPPIVPKANPSLSLSRLETPEFTSQALARLSLAVQTPTESYDIQPVGKSCDDIWAPFVAFQSLLQKEYPNIHKNLERRVVANYSLLYTWHGVNKDDDALLLMAHIDVVPVLPETTSQWTHEPYSGFVDYETQAVEALLTASYLVPERTVYLAFGCDEESDGKGAYAIAQYLQNELKLAGKIGLLVDEGSGLVDFGGIKNAYVSVSEKGYADARLTVETKGGHSSVPPKHTGIGYSALLIAALESNPQEPQLSLNNPIAGSMACYAQHSPNPDPSIVKAVKKWPKTRPQLLKSMLNLLPPEYVTALLVTTQATDIINGGLKVNALPEKVTAIINHRIGSHDSVHTLQTRYKQTLHKLCKDLHLNFTIKEFKDPSLPPFFKSHVERAVGSVTIDALSHFSVLEPSPVSPYNTAQNVGWRILEGTIHHVFDDDVPSGGVIVGPMFSGGNTDTKSYWEFTKSIYRFSPTGENGGAHTVDEWTSMDGFLKSIKFYHELIRNWGGQE
ncbi:UNVERIFIED_CONTAM: hypothetical protein HDU68_008478 [Siphonaria sp. JEL0065]|nr:hypothetical protein HDU68_008478 [Siphonaria sp. JEL0065]